MHFSLHPYGLKWDINFTTNLIVDKKEELSDRRGDGRCSWCRLRCLKRCLCIFNVMDNKLCLLSIKLIFKQECDEHLIDSEHEYTYIDLKFFFVFYSLNNNNLFCKISIYIRILWRVFYFIIYHMRFYF